MTAVLIHLMLAGPPVFTGDVATDFATIGDGIVILDSKDGDPPGTASPDIALEESALASGAEYTGVDVREVRLWYDADTDTMYVGLAFFGIAGDVDGNGNPGTKFPTFNYADAADFVDESVAFRLDTAPDPDVVPGPDPVVFDYVVGIPGDHGIAAFGAYPDNGKSSAFPQSVDEQIAALTGQLTYVGTEQAPDLEFTIPGFCAVLQRADWGFRLKVGGSEDGVAEEAVPTLAQRFGVTPALMVPALQDDDGDNLPNCNDPCQDKDGDGWGGGPGCFGVDCDDTSTACTALCADVDADGIFDCKDPCIDVDEDSLCLGTAPDSDCDDGAATCALDCSDSDTDQIADCKDPCLDNDDDGFGLGDGCLGPDCDDTAASCTTDCSDQDDDLVPDCDDPCVDADEDGLGVGPACTEVDCDDTAATCTVKCVDLDGDDVFDCKDPCLDADGDGFGEGPGCAAADCNDGVATCTTDCTDGDGDVIPDCEDGCEDADGDDYGVGADCAGLDCDDGNAACTDDCADGDGDGTKDCVDTCVDPDGDGYGEGAGCVAADCDESAKACTTDCTNGDGDALPDCADPCIDPDGDGYGQGAGCPKGPCDCDEGNPVCGAIQGQECVEGAACLDSNDDGHADCEACDDQSDLDGDGVPGCFDTDDDGDGLSDAQEVEYGTAPTDPDSDDDLLDDFEEILVHGTDPLDPDTDDGGVIDGKEVAFGTLPKDRPGDDYAVSYRGGGGCTGTTGTFGGWQGLGVALALAALWVLSRRHAGSP